MKQIIKALGFLITTVLVAVLVAAVVLAISSRTSRNGMSTVAGRHVLMVLSGSMEPAINTGDAIVVRPYVKGEQLKEGDVITFQSLNDPNMLITHRITGFVVVNGETVAYTTKGDSNNAIDSRPVIKSLIVGVYQWRIPYFGYISTFIRQPIGIVVFVILPGLILIGMELKKIFTAVVGADEAKQGPAQVTGGDGR